MTIYPRAHTVRLDRAGKAREIEIPERCMSHIRYVAGKLLGNAFGEAIGHVVQGS